MLKKRLILTIIYVRLAILVQPSFVMGLEKENIVPMNISNPNAPYAKDSNEQVNLGESTTIDLNTLVSKHFPLDKFQMTKNAEGIVVIDPKRGICDYTAPAHSKNRTDSFKYKARDKNGQYSNEGTITIYFYDTEID